jgi:hypothetical protein
MIKNPEYLVWTISVIKIYKHGEGANFSTLSGERNEIWGCSNVDYAQTWITDYVIISLYFLVATSYSAEHFKESKRTP